MSSDLYTSEIDDDVYGTLCLEMPVLGNLRIIAYDPGNRDLVGCVNLPPNPGVVGRRGSKKPWGFRRKTGIKC